MWVKKIVMNTSKKGINMLLRIVLGFCSQWASYSQRVLGILPGLDYGKDQHAGGKGDNSSKRSPDDFCHLLVSDSRQMIIRYWCLIMDNNSVGVRMAAVKGKLLQTFSNSGSIGRYGQADHKSKPQQCAGNLFR